MVQLFTRGDDAGSCESANHAVHLAATKGILRNISIMACGPAFYHAGPLLLDIQEKVDLGFHVCLNAEWASIKWGPILPARSVPSLVEPGGHFTQNPGVLNERGFDLGEALAEVEAQYDRLIGAGLTIRYLDQHMGVGWVRGLGNKLQEFAESKGLLFVDQLTFTRYEAIPTLSPGQYVWVTHPGQDEPDMQAFWHEGLREGQIAAERAAETRQLLNPSFQAEIDGGKIAVSRFSELVQ